MELSLKLIVNPVTTNFSIIETGQLICSPNQLTDFFMMGALVVEGLTLH